MLREDIAYVDLSVVIEARYQLGDLGLVRIPDHPFDTRQRGQLFGRALRVAAGDQDAGGAVLAMRKNRRGKRVLASNVASTSRSTESMCRPGGRHYVAARPRRARCGSILNSLIAFLNVMRMARAIRLPGALAGE